MADKTAIWLRHSPNEAVVGELDTLEAQQLVDFDLAYYEGDKIYMNECYHELAEAVQELRYFRDGIPRSY